MIDYEKMKKEETLRRKTSKQVLGEASPEDNNLFVRSKSNLAYLAAFSKNDEESRVYGTKKTLTIFSKDKEVDTSEAHGNTLGFRVSAIKEADDFEDRLKQLEKELDQEK